MEQNDFNTTQMDSRERLRTLYLQPGDIIAENYEFVRELGHGGMGMVCLCRDLVANGRLMAVKTVPDILRHDDDAVAALTREYDNMYSLTNDGIVAVRHLVKDDYRYYVVMDYAEGETLAAYLSNHRKPGEAVALEVIRRIAAALDYAHGKGMVHRDIKPGNVMVQIDGDNIKSMKLLDFGLGLQIRKSFSRTTGQLTSGTPAYKSPEQWDPRRFGKPSFNSDQYSLAAMAYEMLSGNYPFAEFDDMETFRVAVLNDAPERIDGIAEYMNDALQKALAKRPEARFENCMAFVEVLDSKEDAKNTQQFKPSKKDPPAIVTRQVDAVELEKGEQTKGNLKFQLSSDVELELIHIPAGTFMMGDEGEQHQVILTKDFWIGKFPITQAQYNAITGSNPSEFKEIRIKREPLKEEPSFLQKLFGISKEGRGVGEELVSQNNPVGNISWEEAIRYCVALTEKYDGKMPLGYEFMLPTEAQWEYACRAGTMTDLNSGRNLLIPEGEDPYLNLLGWYDKNSDGKTHPVGVKKPNAWGLYDMHGNVLEWCRDWYGDYPSGSVTDPVGPSSGSYRVFRGGSWYTDARSCRSAFRDFLDPERRGVNLGFRVALAPVQ